MNADMPKDFYPFVGWIGFVGPIFTRYRLDKTHNIVFKIIKRLRDFMN